MRIPTPTPSLQICKPTSSVRRSLFPVSLLTWKAFRNKENENQALNISRLETRFETHAKFPQICCVNARFLVPAATARPPSTHELRSPERLAPNHSVPPTPGSQNVMQCKITHNAAVLGMLHGMLQHVVLLHIAGRLPPTWQLAAALDRLCRRNKQVAWALDQDHKAGRTAHCGAVVLLVSVFPVRHRVVEMGLGASFHSLDGSKSGRRDWCGDSESFGIRGNIRQVRRSCPMSRGNGRFPPGG